MFGKASKQHDLIQPSTSVGLSLAFRRDSFLYHNLNSGTHSSLNPLYKTLPKL